jgi:hypothetical protein
MRTPQSTHPPAISHHHSITKFLSGASLPQPPHSIAPHPASGRPGLDRAHTFPTPPNSGSSQMGMSNSGSSYAHGGAQARSNSQAVQYQTIQSYDISRQVYSAPYGDYPNHKNMNRYDVVQSSSAIKSEMGPPGQSSFLNRSSSTMQPASPESTGGTDGNDVSESVLRAGTVSASPSTEDFEEAADHSTETDELTASIQSVVRDLQSRVDQLLCKTEIRRRQFTMSPTKTPELARRRSLPLIFSSGQCQRTDDYSDTHSTGGTQSSDDHVPSESPPFHRKEPASVASDLEPRPNLSQFSIRPGTASVGSGRPVSRVRARSEPPAHRVKLLLSNRATFGLRAHVYAAGQESNNISNGQNNDLGLQGSLQKRKNRESGEDEERERDRENGSNGKRRKVLSPEVQKSKLRFPCIFHAGERDRYSLHTKKYEYIAQLL